MGWLVYFHRLRASESISSVADIWLKLSPSNYQIMELRKRFENFNGILLFSIIINFSQLRFRAYISRFNPASFCYRWTWISAEFTSIGPFPISANI